MTSQSKILVVDDTPHNVKLLADLLGAKGYQVETATSGPEALTRIAAGAPDSGQSFDAWWKPYKPAPGAAEIKPYGEGYVALTLEGVRKHFVQDVPADEADIVYATQGPLAVKCFSDTISEAAWRSKRSWYIVAARDETIPPDVQRDSASRMGAETLVLQSSHVPMLSQPEVVAEFIANAAASVGN